MTQKRISKLALGISAGLMVMGVTGTAFAAPDPGKKACAKEARVLCPAEMKALSRKRVEACMVKNIEKTSPTCKAAMLRIKAEREGAGKT